MTESSIDNRPYWKIYKPPYCEKNIPIVVSCEEGKDKSCFNPFQSQLLAKEHDYEDENHNQDEEYIKIEKMLRRKLKEYLSKTISISKRQNTFYKQHKLFHREYTKGAVRLLHRSKRNMIYDPAMEELEKKKANAESEKKRVEEEKSSQSQKKSMETDSDSSSDSDVDPRWAQCIAESMKVLNG